MKTELPYVRTIKEVVTVPTDLSFGLYSGDRVFVIISKDDGSGHRGRYNAIAVDRKTMKAKCIGRELPLAHCRVLAKFYSPRSKKTRITP